MQKGTERKTLKASRVGKWKWKWKWKWKTLFQLLLSKPLVNCFLCILIFQICCLHCPCWICFTLHLFCRGKISHRLIIIINMLSITIASVLYEFEYILSSVRHTYSLAENPGNKPMFPKLYCYAIQLCVCTTHSHSHSHSMLCLIAIHICLRIYARWVFINFSMPNVNA